LLFGLQIYEASFHEFTAYGLTHLAASLMLTNFQFGRVRWPFISELYEIAQAPFLSRAVLSVFLRPRAPTFNVTAKAETLERSFVSHLGRPLLLLFGLLLLGAGVGMLRWQHFPLERENLAIVLGWNLFNMLFVLGALGVVYEQKQRRGMPRVPRWLDASVRIGAVTAPARITDLSVGGAQLALGQGASLYRDLAHGAATLLVDTGDGPRELPIEIRHVVVQDDTMLLGTRFDAKTAKERSDVVRLCFGDSNAWVAFQAARQRSRSILGGFSYFLSLVVIRGSAGLVAVLRDRALVAGHGPGIGSVALPVALPQGERTDAIAR
jgi:cellulose synthase (UDP-forming)